MLCLKCWVADEGGPHHHSPRLRHETARRHRQRKSSSASWSSPAAAVYLIQFSVTVSTSVSMSRGTIEEHQSAHCTSPLSTVGVWLKTIIISSANNSHLHIVSALHLYAKWLFTFPKGSISGPEGSVSGTVCIYLPWRAGSFGRLRWVLTTRLCSVEIMVHFRVHYCLRAYIF